nr:MAG TPA: minor tail protein [Caudoviricetes sp.]
MAKKQIYSFDYIANLNTDGLLKSWQQFSNTIRNTKLKSPQLVNLKQEINNIDDEIKDFGLDLQKGVKTPKEFNTLVNKFASLSKKMEAVNKQKIEIKVVGGEKELDELNKKIRETKTNLSNVKNKQVRLPAGALKDIKGTKGDIAYKKYRSEFKKADKSGSLDYLDSIKSKLSVKNLQGEGLSESEAKKTYAILSQVADQYNQKLQEQIKLKQELEVLNQQADAKQIELTEQLNTNINEEAEHYKEVKQQRDQINSTFKEQSNQINVQEELNQKVGQFTGKLKSLVSMTTLFWGLRSAITSAYQEIKELDTAFNEISVATGKSMNEMWDSFSTVNRMAQEYGVTTQGVVEVQNLYYHQGLETAEVNQLTGETLTLAKIAGLDYADATDKMTAAMNAFGIAASDANTIVDTMAALDANAAVSTDEVANALTKTASIAANAGMDIQSTSVLLTKMIETTRESSENLGTALKTVIARFTELKSAVDEDSDGEVADFNKVETALRSAGVSLKDSAGQFRDVDDVFMDLSKVWDTLDRNTQRYIATQAAGSRQQSRFIAMMEDYDRTLELTQIAQDSAGTGTEQLERSQVSLDSTLNKIKGSWQELYTTYLKSDTIRGFLENVNKLLVYLNKLSDAGKTFSIIWAGVTIALMKPIVTKGVENFSKKLVDGWFGNKEKEGLKKKITNFLKDSVMQPLSKTVKNTKKSMDFFGTKNGYSARKEARKLKKEKTSQFQKDTLKELSGKITPQGQEQFPEATKRFLEYDSKKVQSTFSTVDKKALSTEQAELLTKKMYNKELKIQDGYLIDINGKQQALALSQEQLNAMEQSGIHMKEVGTATNIAEANSEKVENSALMEQIAARKANIVALKEEAIAFITSPVGAVLTAIAAAIGLVVAGIALWKKAEKDAVESSEKNAKRQAEAYTNLKDTLIETRNLAQDYNEALELSKKIRTTEEEQKYQEILQSMLDTYPDLIEYVDENTLALKDSNAALNEGSDAYKNYIKTMQQEASADIADSYNAVTLAAEGNLDTSLIEDNTVVKRIEAIRENTNKVYSELLQDIKDSNGKALEEVNELFAKLSKYDITEGNLKGALSQQNQKGFTSSVLNTLLGTDIDASQFQQVLDQIHRGGSLKQKEFKESMGWDSNQAKAVQAYYEEFKSTIDAYVNNLYDSTGNASQIAAMQAAQKIGENVAAGLGKTLPSNMNSIISHMIEDGEADEDAIENFVNKYYKSLSTVQQNTLDNFIENVTDKGLTREQTEEQTRNLCAMLGFDEKTVQAVLKTIDDRAKVLEKKRNAIKNQLTNKTVKGRVDKLSTEEVQALSTQLSTVETKTNKATMNKVGDTLTQLYGDKSLSNEQKQAVMGADLYDLDSIIAVRQELEGCEEAEKLFNKAVEESGPLSKKNLGTAQTRLESINKTIDSINTNMEYFEDAITGELDFSGYASLITAAQGALNNSDFEVGKTGFRLKTDSIDKTKKALIAKAKSELQNQQSVIQEAKAEIYRTMALKDSTLAMLEQQKTQANDINKKKELQKTIDDINNKSEDYSGELKALQEQYENLNTQEEELNAATPFIEKMSQQIEESALVDRLQDAADKLNNIYDLLQSIVDLISGVDIWENIDNLNDVLDLKLSNYEATIDLNLNPIINEKAYTDKVKTLGQQATAARGEKQVATKDTSYWSKQVKGSKYLDIGEDGNLVKNKNYYKLVASAKNAKTDPELQMIQKEIEAADNLVTKYTDSYKRMKEADTKEQETLAKLQEYRSEAIDKMADLSKTLLDIMIANDEKELENYKKTVDKKKEALDDYLDAVQDAIDKERNMRDIQDKEEDLRQKERKLSILQMDTSGLYAGDVASLQKEISDDRQSLEDTYVDNYVDNLSKQIDNQKEAYERDINRWEDYLEFKKEDMTEYQSEIDNIISSGTDSIVTYITTKSNEITGMTKQQLAQFNEDTKQTVNDTISQYKSLNNGEIKRLLDSLNKAATDTTDIDDATQKFASNAMTSYDGVNSSVQILANSIADLAGNLNSDLTDAWGKAQGAAEKYLKKLDDVAKAQKALEDKDWESMINTSTGNKGGKSNVNKNPTTVYGKKDATIQRYSIKNGKVNIEKTPGHTTLSKEYDFEDTQTIGGKTYYKSNSGYWYDSADFSVNKPEEKVGVKTVSFTSRAGQMLWGTDKTRIDKHQSDIPDSFKTFYNPGTTFKFAGQKTSKKTGVTWLYDKSSKKWIYDAARLLSKEKLAQLKQYKNGGYVDYTGPAWVDGTPTKPEAFLNAADTQRMEALIGVLQQLGTGLKSPTVSSNPTSNQTSNSIQVEINVDELGSEYDVEQLARDVQNTIYKNMTKGQTTFLR